MVWYDLYHENGRPSWKGNGTVVLYVHIVMTELILTWWHRIYFLNVPPSSQPFPPVLSVCAHLNALVGYYQKQCSFERCISMIEPSGLIFRYTGLSWKFHVTGDIFVAYEFIQLALLLVAFATQNMHISASIACFTGGLRLKVVISNPRLKHL